MAMGLNIGDNIAENTKAVISMVRSKVKGKMADIERGRILHKQGYGESYESASSIAKKGKTGQKPKRVRNTSVYVE